jgi:hypothetical protein
VIDHVAAVIDQRIQTTAFSAEGALTKDTVPVNASPSDRSADGIDDPIISRSDAEAVTVGSRAANNHVGDERARGNLPP